jgi:asparagine synthase (glutamine-hydrolysing)
MCGIASILSLRGEPLPRLDGSLRLMNDLQTHRGPDGAGIWSHHARHVGLASRRLAIIDLLGGDQPMTDGRGNWVVQNGEIYNFVELRTELGLDRFATHSDTEVILHAYNDWGPQCVTRFRGMFAFALWDEAEQTLFCARDRFGIKPLYYTVVGDILYVASEVKALLPFVPHIRTSLEALNDYLTFQFCLAGKTLFEDIHELLPGHTLVARNAAIRTERYWEVYYEPDLEHTEFFFEEATRRLLEDSAALHLRSDVPVGVYLSGGLDSSIIASLASEHAEGGLAAFLGKFPLAPEYDEGEYARAVAEHRDLDLYEVEITPRDFVEKMPQVIYHLDFPVAGPGSFAQFVVSETAARHRKVVLGGQGGDEVFGGYVRYLLAYFEQCIRGAIEGTLHAGQFVVTYESIIPNLRSLAGYEPLLQDFWREGLFGELDERYFRLVNRAREMGDEVRWDLLENYSPFETFKAIFHGRNVAPEAYFDSMSHFDFKTLLPALLHVEDRVSMAHGLEARVPFLDYPLVELAASMPALVKFKNGTMKHILKKAMAPVLPRLILDRTDKMGFPVPLQEWMRTDGIVRDFVIETLSSREALGREVIDNGRVFDVLDREPRFSRRIWALLCLELWQRAFHDRESVLRKQAKEIPA